MKKRCNGPCGRTLPWAEFYAKTRWPDGTTRVPHSRCKRCLNKGRTAWARDNRARHNATNRAERVRLRDDRPRLVRRQALQREYATDWRRRRGIAARATPATIETLPAAPFASWLRRYFGHLITVAEAAGVQERVLRRIVNGEQANVSVDTVDRVLLAIDDETTVADLYPMAA